MSRNLTIADSQKGPVRLSDACDDGVERFITMLRERITSRQGAISSPEDLR